MCFFALGSDFRGKLISRIRTFQKVSKNVKQVILIPGECGCVVSYNDWSGGSVAATVNKLSHV